MLPLEVRDLKPIKLFTDWFLFGNHDASSSHSLSWQTVILLHQHIRFKSLNKVAFDCQIVHSENKMLRIAQMRLELEYSISAQ